VEVAGLPHRNVETAELAFKLAIDNGTERRPARRANAGALFLTHWEGVRADIASRDRERGLGPGSNAHGQACQSCRQAEDVAHMDNQALFDLRGPNRR
jgi:hypothetical protein